jgi:thiamine-phosphate pyrophosphorylase
MSSLSRLMLVSDRRRFDGDRMPSTIAAALTAGPALVQIREQDLSDDAVLHMADQIRRQSGPENIIIVNGRPAVAVRAGAGLHLSAARTALLETRPPCILLGCSVHDTGEIESARAFSPDYLVAGTVFKTLSKPGIPGCGLAGLRRLVAAAEGIPVYAIGGMDRSHVEAVLGAGAYGVAVSGGVLGAGDPAQAALRYLKALGAGHDRQNSG